MMTLAWPWMLLALPLPLVVWATAPPAPPGGFTGGPESGSALRLPGVARLDAPSGPVPRPARGWQGLAMVAWSLLALAAARPQWLDEPVPLPVSGRDLMLAVDISGSMAQGVAGRDGGSATRLALVKAAAAQFVERRPHDRIGLILFGSRPYVQTPLTYDHATVAQMLEEAVVGLAGRDTAIGDAVGLGIKRLRQAPPGERVLILLTDGDNTAGSSDPLAMARIAADAGIRIHTIGLAGTLAAGGGAYSSVPATSPRRADDLNPTLLRGIAAAAGGRFFLATDGADLDRVYRLLDRLEPSIRDARAHRPAHERYPWPAAGALLLTLVLAAGLGRGRSSPRPCPSVAATGAHDL